MPAPLKPPSRRAGHAKRATLVAPLADGVARVVPPMPPAPSGRWLRATSDAWGAYWSSEVSRTADIAVDAGLLARWVFTLDELERARRAFREQRVVAGSKGQPRLSPAGKLVLELSAELARIEQQLGIGPLNRMRLGIALGDAAESLGRLWDDVDDEPEIVAVGVSGGVAGDDVIEVAQ